MYCSNFWRKLAIWQVEQRVFPKLIGIFMGWMGWIVTDWVMNVETLTMEHATIQGAVFAAFAAYAKFYVESGTSLRELQKLDKDNKEKDVD